MVGRFKGFDRSYDFHPDKKGELGRPTCGCEPRVPPVPPAVGTGTVCRDRGCRSRYLMAALRGHIKPETLQNYRKGHAHLPGHPEVTESASRAVTVTFLYGGTEM